MITIEASEHIRFNVHTLSPANEKVKTMFYILLKRDSGTLTTGDFSFESIFTYHPLPTRGRIVIEGNKLLVDAEVGQEDVSGAVTNWGKSYANGEYQLVR